MSDTTIYADVQRCAYGLPDEQCDLDAGHTGAHLTEVVGPHDAAERGEVEQEPADAVEELELAEALGVVGAQAEEATDAELRAALDRAAELGVKIEYIHTVAVRLDKVLDQLDEVLPSLVAASAQAGPMLAKFGSHPLAQMFLPRPNGR